MTRTRGATLVVTAIFSLLPWGLLPAVAQTARLGQAQNAIGTLVVVRPDGIELRLNGKGALPVFEGDVLRTEASSQALFEFRDGVQVALNENTTFRILSRWEKTKGITHIVRLTRGEVWVRGGGNASPVEVETPVAVAAARETEFNVKSLEDGRSVLTVIRGSVEFSTPFGACPVGASAVSYGVRGQTCTAPAPADVRSVVAWTQALLK
jgi:ferric-dicitrate binding protein FerR (iron transport regulator)